MKTKVSISACADYDEERVYQTLKNGIALIGGISIFARKGERILIKPNILTGKPPESAVTTHPSVVKSVIRLVQECGAVPIVGDSPALGAAHKAAEKCGILSVCRETGAEFVELKTPVTAANPAGRTFKVLEVAREAQSVDGVINVAKLKTHAQMYLTLGIKNVFGCVPGKKKAQWHLSAGVDSAYFAAMLLDLYAFINPRLNIVDGITAMEGNGPGNGDPRRLGLLFTSANAVCMDTVITEALGGRINDVPVLKVARLRGMETTELGRIDVVGEQISRIGVKGFKFPPHMHTNFTAGLPYFLDKRLRKALTSRPRIDNSRCTLCSICVNACPAEVMKAAGRIEIDYDACIRCYCCQEMCPQGAITPCEGWLKKIIPGL